MNVAADLFTPQGRKEKIVYDVSLVIGGSVFLALCAQIAVDLPFSPVPVTGQTFGVLLAGVLLGSRKAAASVILYLLEGAAGLPVFAGAEFGIIHLYGPSAGYLIGFLPSAFFMGIVAEKGWIRNILLLALGLIIANALILLPGIAWLGWLAGFERVLDIGFFPVLPGAFFKSVLVWGIVSLSWKRISKQ